MKKRVLLLLFLGTAILNSCEYKIIELEDPIPPINFVTDIEPTLDSKCASSQCHAIQNPIMIKGFAYASLTEGGYINTENPDQSIIYIKASTGDHPVLAHKQLNEEELANLLRWIEEGATAEIKPISFSEEIEPIFQDNCITCHTNTNPNLTSGNAYNNLINGGYINTDNTESSSLYTKITSGHPTAGTLNQTEIRLILTWIQEGAQNN